MIRDIYNYMVHGDGYQITSGPVVLGALLTLYWKHHCHSCWRIARYHIGGHLVPSCKKHRTVIAAAEAGTITPTDS